MREAGKQSAAQSAAQSADDASRLRVAREQEEALREAGKQSAALRADDARRLRRAQALARDGDFASKEMLCVDDDDVVMAEPVAHAPVVMLIEAGLGDCRPVVRYDPNDPDNDEVISPASPTVSDDGEAIVAAEDDESGSIAASAIALAAAEEEIVTADDDELA